MANQQAVAAKAKKMKRADYEEKLEELQAELCYLQDWIKQEGQRIIVVFEGRDAALEGRRFIPEPA